MSIARTLAGTLLQSGTRLVSRAAQAVLATPAARRRWPGRSGLPSTAAAGWSRCRSG